LSLRLNAETERILKDTTYTDGAEAHAQRFEQMGPELEALLTMMTSKEIKSQYFTEQLGSSQCPGVV
jgi:hypothetical protein